MMEMEVERHDGGNQCYYPSPYSDRAKNRFLKSPISPRANHFASDTVAGVSFIEHSVSRMDTLAGVAIKYGVEVSDIKRINGLVTDLQMFALKTLQIPTPGRHPPSSCYSNGSDAPRNHAGQSSSRRHSDIFDSLHSLRASPHRNVSPAMSKLLGYYGLRTPPTGINKQENFEMDVSRVENGHYSMNAPSPTSNRPLSSHRKSRSFANGFITQDMEFGNEVTQQHRDFDNDKSNDKLCRRRQKSEADFNSRFSPIMGNGIALRSKATTKISETINSLGLGDFLRKSSSTSNLQDQESSNSSSSIWSSSKWSLKPDLQALSTAAMARPIFDALPKPITSRRNKAALD